MFKLKTRAILLLFFLSSALIGCQNDNPRPEESESAAEFAVHPQLLMDRDALLARLQYIHDYIGKEYQDEQLQKMEKDSIYQNYKKVLQNFVKEELHQEIDSFQTIIEAADTRWMAVTTKDEKVYKISLKKRNDYNEIWTVNSYAELLWKSYPLEEKQKEDPQIETAKPNVVGVKDFTSDCSKVVIPDNVELDTNLNQEEGLLTVHWFDQSEGKDLGIVFRYNEKNCSQSAKEIAQHVLEFEITNRQ